MDPGFFFFFACDCKQVHSKQRHYITRFNVTGCQHLQTNLENSNIRDAEDSTRKCQQDKAETERVHCNRNSRHS